MENFHFDSIKTKTLKDIIYNKLKARIMYNQFPSSHYITEQNLAGQLEVSRTPLREAMMELVNEELIEFKPRKGYKVREYSENEIDQIFLLRRVIECEIIKPLFDNITTDHLKVLKGITQKQRKFMELDDGFEFINLDKEFHREMFLISGYNIFLRSYDVFHNLTILIGSQAIRERGRMEEVVQEHNDIIASLENRDHKLMEQAVTYHLTRTKNMYANVQKKKQDNDNEYQ